MLYLPFSRYELWLLALPALVVLLWHRGVLLWLLSGFTFFFVSLRCANIASIEYGGVNPLLSYAIFTPFAFLLSLYQFLLPLWINMKLFRNSVWALPFLYTASEVLRSHFPYGGFPWLIVGSLSVHIPLIKHSLLYANVYLQSLLFLLSALLFLRKRFKSLLFIWLLFALLGLFAIGEKEGRLERAKAIRVALVQTGVPQRDKLDPSAFRRHAEGIIKLTEEAMVRDVDLVVLPESAFHFFYSDEKDEYNFWLKSLSFRTPILVGLIDLREGLKPYNSAYLLKGGTAVGQYDKMRLFPIGEYMPFPFGFLKAFFPALSGIDYLPGEELRPIEYGIMRIATPICFEVAYHSLVDRLGERANLLAVLTNDGWFEDSDCTTQHYLWARVRAMETGKYLLWVNNSGDTGIIDPMGRILERLPYMKRGVVYGEVLLVE